MWPLYVTFVCASCMTFESDLVAWPPCSTCVTSLTWNLENKFPSSFRPRGLGLTNCTCNRRGLYICFKDLYMWVVFIWMWVHQLQTPVALHRIKHHSSCKSSVYKHIPDTSMFSAIAQESNHFCFTLTQRKCMLSQCLCFSKSGPRFQKYWFLLNTRVGSRRAWTQHFLKRFPRSGLNGIS